MYFEVQFAEHFSADLALPATLLVFLDRCQGLEVQVATGALEIDTAAAWDARVRIVHFFHVAL